MKRLSISILILCACFVPVTSVTCYSNWSEFHRPNMKRYNPCEKVLNVNNVGKLGLKWSYYTGLGSASSSAVANGVVYLGSDDINVYALKASTGAPVWSYQTNRAGGGVDSSPAVAKWGRICRLPGQQRVRAERDYRRPAVELPHRRLCGLLARRGQWGGSYRIGR